MTAFEPIAPVFATAPARAALLRGAAALGLLLAAVPGPARSDTLLHAFNWPYAEVTTHAREIGEAGIRIVLVAPAYRSEGSAWWARYQPQDYRLIDSPLGNTEDFAAMVAALRDHGVRTYADVVFNHMANETAQRADLDYPGARVLGIYARDPDYHALQRLFGDLGTNLVADADFGPQACIGDYGDVHQVQTLRLCMGAGDRGLPDLLPTPRVVGQQQGYLRALKGLGVSGFRIDAAKHMSLAHINAVFTKEIKAGVHVFGELITGGGRGHEEYEAFLGPYLAGTDHSAYDFPLFAQIRAAFAFGGSMARLVDPGAFGQALAPARAVTFAVTHDIPNNGIFRGLLLDPVDETLAYAYLFGRDGGIPMLYSDHNESGDDRWVNAWRRGDLRSMIRFHNAVQGSDMQILAYGHCHLVFRRGDRGLVGINKCADTVSPDLDMRNSVLWWHADYRDALGSGHVVRVTGPSYRVLLPPRSARLWLRD